MKIAALITSLLAGLALGETGDPVGPPGGDGGRFKPGWNGMARTPPLGWRSWNAFGNRIYDSTFREAIDALTVKNWSVDGSPAKISLADVGYASVGIDEGWEGCGMGVNHTQHYGNGTPAVNTKFPDMAGLVEYGHSKNLRMGFYQNGCACGERVEKVINYEGDVAYLHEMGFDAVKLDGCGHQRNMTLYAELMQATGKNYSIENCHWGRCTDSDDSSCPTADWCPFNWYRSSGDINAGTMSWFNNLQTTIRFSDWANPVSQPGCWAYPDMLEVGRVQGSKEWNRAHFGAWCIISAPLVLGMDLTPANLEPIIDIITNKEALAVNQAWEGHPGSLVWSRPVPPPPPPPAPPGPPGPPPSGPMWVEAVKCDPGSKTQTGWSLSGGAVKIGDRCLDGTADKTHVQAKTCDGSAGQKFVNVGGELQGDGGCLDVWDFAGPRVDIYPCNKGHNQIFICSPTGELQFNSGQSGKGPAMCLQLTDTEPGGNPPRGGDQIQLWAKPQPAGAMAVLVINSAVGSNVTAVIDFTKLNMTDTRKVHARDIWARKDIAAAVSDSITVDVPAQDSAFILLTPT